MLLKGGTGSSMFFLYFCWGKTFSLPLPKWLQDFHSLHAVLAFVCRLLTSETLSPVQDVCGMKIYLKCVPIGWGGIGTTPCCLLSQWAAEANKSLPPDITCVILQLRQGEKNMYYIMGWSLIPVPGRPTFLPGAWIRQAGVGQCGFHSWKATLA